MTTTEFVALVRKLRAAQTRAKSTRAKDDISHAERVGVEVDLALLDGVQTDLFETRRSRDGDYLGGS